MIETLAAEQVASTDCVAHPGKSEWRDSYTMQRDLAAHNPLPLEVGCARHFYRPFQTGLRFSAKARVPSFKSSEWFTACTLAIAS